MHCGNSPRERAFSLRSCKGRRIIRTRRHTTVLKPGSNVWRVERAHRAAVLIDAAATYRAMREAMAKAQQSIFILGWDIDSRTRLVGEKGTAEDGLPDTLAAFLSALVARRPQLTVHLLLWDYSMLYSLEREFLPEMALNWNTPDQVRFCLDRKAPLGCSHHQKIVIVDDAVAFSGGLDLTIRRWDTCEHKMSDPHRVDPAGEPYRPFHDVQAIVDGDAARALAELARERWKTAACAHVDVVNASGDPWPESVKPDFEDIAVGIARTQPCTDAGPAVREVEQLFHDTIDVAERELYIENQFLTVEPIAQRIARRMKKRRDLETLIVAPATHSSWIESQTMRGGRIRFRDAILKGDPGERFRLTYPEVSDGEETTDTMIHSKIMVVDDRLLRVGSANLNKRSMGADTECDLIFEAASDKHRAAILRVRNRLIGDHCGSSREDVAELLEDTGSIVAVSQMLCGHGHCLRDIDDGEFDADEFNAAIEELADPDRPLSSQTLIQRAKARLAGIAGTRFVALAATVAIVAALALAWAFTPLSDYARLDAIRSVFNDFAREPWAPAAVLAAFIGGGLVAFPVTVLIAATAAVFGPWLGLAYGAAGAMVSAIVTYCIGAWIGRDALRSLTGKRLTRALERVRQQGVVAIAAIRLVPIAPFSVINLAAGAGEIRVFDFVLGTLLGLAPGLILMSAMGAQAMRMLSHPGPAEFALLAGFVVLWLVASFGVQRLVTRFAHRDA